MVRKQIKTDELKRINSLGFDDVDKNDDNNEETDQISLISHISMHEVIQEDAKFDKWDILFNNEDHE